MLYGSAQASENASKRRRRREDTIKKREASCRLAVDANRNRKSNQNQTRHTVNRDTYYLQSFKKIPKKQPATFAFITPKAGCRKRTDTPMGDSKNVNSRHGLPRGVGFLNLGGTDHGSDYQIRSKRPQTAGSTELRRKRSYALDSKNVSSTLPAKAPGVATTQFMPRHPRNTPQTAANSISPTQRGKARRFSIGTLRAKAVQNLRSRPTPLTRKKERIARRLGIVPRPGSAPTSRKKKNCISDQDDLMFDVCAPIRPGKQLNDYILLKNHADDMTAYVGLMDDAIGSIDGAERLITNRNETIDKILKNNADQVAVIDHKVMEREKAYERKCKQAQIERGKDHNWKRWRIRSKAVF